MKRTTKNIYNKPCPTYVVDKKNRNIVTYILNIGLCIIFTVVFFADFIEFSVKMYVFFGI